MMQRDQQQEEQRDNLSGWSIDHPHLIIATYAAIVALAIYVVFGNVMPRRMMPYVESPIVGVVTEVPGLSAEEMETYVSCPIETHLSGVRGARAIRSTSQDGLSIVSIEFPYGDDMRRAYADIQSIITTVQADIPRIGPSARPPRVIPIDPLNVPVLAVSLTGDRAQGWTPMMLREFAETNAAVTLKQIPKVEAVEVYGGQRREIRVTVNRDRLSRAGYSILDVRAAIDRGNIARPAGILTSGLHETLLRVDTLASAPKEIGDCPLGARYGHVTLVRDVASVEYTASEQRSGFHFVNNTIAPGRIEGIHDEAVELAVIEDPDASSPQVIGAVNGRLCRMEADHPGLHFRIAYDNARFVNILFRNTGEELIIAILLCGVAVLLFLGDWRGTVISMTTIPVSMAMAIVAMVPFGFSLNSSTLIGLLLSIGRLVDDSVIDIHAIQRHLTSGKDVRHATVEGITEVRRAVGASTVILAVALAPLLFCGGVTQAMFVGLVYPIIFGLLSSFLVSLTLTAVMAARLLKPEPLGLAPITDRRRPGLLRAVRARLDRMDARYERLVRALLRRRFAVLATAACVIIVGFGFYSLIGSEMMPLADVGQAYAVLEVQPGASYAQTAKATAALERILLRHREITRVSTEIGSEPNTAEITGYSMNRLNAASMMITLSDKDERSESIWQVIDGVRNEAADIGYRISCLQIKEMGSDVMASSDAPVEILVTGPNAQVLSRLAEQIADIARKTDGAYQVSTSWSVQKPTLQLKIDARRAAAVGLTPSDVAEQVSYSIGGGDAVERYRSNGLQSDSIEMRYREDQRRTQADLLATRITAPDGQQLPLRSLAYLKAERRPTVIEHDGLKRAISVMAYYRKEGPPSMDLTMTMLAKASSELNFPPGYGIEVRGDMTQMMDSFARLLRGLGLAMVFILLALIAQFRGALAPLQMLLSVPLELTGVFAGLYLAHQAFSSVSIMAVIVLTGMDVTTAILMIDQIVRRRRTPGIRTEDAIALACRDRLRPILMTSLITIVTMAPVAFVPRTGLDAYQPLGTVIVFGLLAGTLMSLLVIPVMHSVVDDMERWIRAKLFRRREDEAITLRTPPMPAEAREVAASRAGK